PVLEYATSARRPVPLRISVLTRYENGEWSEARGAPLSDGLPTPTTTDATTETIDVTSNLLGAPQLAVPYPTVDLSIEASWQSRRDGTIVVDRRTDRYSATYLDLDPDEAALQREPGGYL